MANTRTPLSGGAGWGRLRRAGRPALVRLVLVMADDAQHFGALLGRERGPCGDDSREPVVGAVRGYVTFCVTSGRDSRIPLGIR